MEKLVIDHVTYKHSKKTPFEVTALSDICLSVEAGKITGLIGHTGSGKSTLVELCNGLLRPDEGKVFLDGEDIWKKPKKMRSVHFRVGLVMQYPEYQLFEDTIGKDIAYGPKNMGLSEEEIAERVNEAADFVGLDRGLLDASPFDLSGGQKRRAAIAGVMAMRPEILILDEPAAGLDPQGRESIFSGLSAYQKKSGTTVVIVSHSMDDMAKYCDNVAVLAHGKLIMQGTAAEVFSRADELIAVGLDVPQVTKLMLSLREKGIAVDTKIYSEEDAIRAISLLFGKNGG